TPACMPPAPQSPRLPNDRRRRGMPGRPGSSVWYALGLLLILGIAQVYFLAPGGRTIPYSEFRALVKQGAVAEVTISDQLLHGTLKQPASGDPKQSKQFSTTRVEDPKLIEELEAQSVKYS